MTEWLDELWLKTSAEEEVVVVIAGLKAGLMTQPQSE